MKTLVSDAADAVCRNSVYACARARLTESFDIPCQLRQTLTEQGLTA